MLKNVAGGLLVLAAAGIAAWLFLPLASEPVESPALPASVIVPIGPLQVNLMLVVLLIAGGVPAAGLVMGLLMQWLSGKVPPGASTPSITARTQNNPTPAAAGERAPLSVAQQLGLWLLIAIMLALIVFLVAQVLPPGFSLL